VRTEGFGLAVDAPPGWEARIFRLPDGLPTLHVANLPLPSADGDFGGTALASMGDGGAFLALTEYGPALAGRGLFASPRLAAPLSSSDLDPRALQRIRSGQRGAQRFFTVAGRPFCLYVVVAASGPSLAPLVREVNAVIGTIEIGTSSVVPLPRATTQQDPNRRM
jgi:hypothetical protein